MPFGAMVSSMKGHDRSLSLSTPPPCREALEYERKKFLPEWKMQVLYILISVDCVSHVK